MPEELSSTVVAQTWSGPISPPERCPESADVVIIGGGIVGVSTAWFLAKRGINVVLCEKGFIAGEQSGRNWGWVRQQGRDVRELPMMMESIRIFRTLADEIGEDVGFSQGGCLFTTSSEKEMQAFHEWRSIAADYELDTTVIDAAALKRQVEGCTAKWLGALYTASDGRAEPHKTTPAIARAAAREGATILTACAVLPRRDLGSERQRVLGDEFHQHVPLLLVLDNT